MGTIRTNILVEVDEKINNLVVVPHKRNKTFAKLMASLLKGYVEDDYIRAYAEGTLDDMRRASVDVLDEALDSMSASLSNMGMLGGALKANTQMGVKKFGDYAKEKEEEISRSDELNDLKDTVDGLKSQNAQILEMLQRLSNGITSGTVNIQPVVQEVQPTVIKEVVKEVVKEEPKVEEPTTKQVEEDNTFVEAPKPVLVEDTPDVYGNESPLPEVEEDDEEESIDAGNLLSSLMSGNQYSFS